MQVRNNTDGFGPGDDHQAATPPDRKPLPPGQIPDHDLIRRIGQGSYGEVWLGRSMTGAFRAIKFVHRKTFESDRPFQRELDGIQKFEPISRSHEGFVDVLHVGQNPDHGYFYYVMELGDDERNGQTIDPEHYVPKTLASELSARRRLPVGECLRLGQLLSNALGHLHKHGLVHRDVKPANIVFVNGAPKLADIGLVASVHQAPSYVGTEGYIPPEGPGTPLADIYSLGKVLYEMSTGKDRLAFPELPDELNELAAQSAFLELNEVVLLACQTDCRKRYQSAEAMHADLMVVESGKSIKRLHWLERRLALTRKIAAATLVALLLASVALFYLYRERKLRELVVQYQQRQVGASVARGTDAMNRGDLLGSLPSFVEALRLDRQDPKREESHRLRLGTVLAQSPKLVQRWFHGAQMNDAEFSPDGLRVIVAEMNGKAQVWNVGTDRPSSPLFSPKHGLETACFSPDGRVVVTACKGESVDLWDSKTAERILHIPQPTMVFDARFSPDGQRIVSAGADGKIRFWDPRAGGLLGELKGHTMLVTRASYSRDGRLLLTTSYDKTARIWDAASFAPVGSAIEHPSWVYHGAFNPDGSKVVTGCFDRKARVWDVQSGKQILPAMEHGDGVRSAEFSPDGRLIVTASWDSTVRLWDADTHQPFRPNPIIAHGNRVMHASFAPDGHRILATGIDGVTCIWDLAPGLVRPQAVQGAYSGDGTRFSVTGTNWIQVLEAQASNSVSPRFTLHPATAEVALNRNGRFLLALSASSQPQRDDCQTLQLWDVSTGLSNSLFLPRKTFMTNLQVSDDGRFLLSMVGSAVDVYDRKSGQAVSRVKPEGAKEVRAGFSPSGNTLFTFFDRQAQVWHAASGVPAFAPIMFPPKGRISHAEFSPDSRLLVTCGTDHLLTEHAAHIWCATTGKSLAGPLRHRDGVLHASFSPDGRRLVTSSEDFTAIVWDVATGKQLLSPLRHDDQVREAFFDPDGRWIVTASQDSTARVWDAETGDPITPPARHPAAVFHARFVANGQRILTQLTDGDSYLWELPRDRRPLQDLVLLARLLSGHRGRLEPDAATEQASALPAVWQQLGALYPSDFAATSDQVFAWHWIQAELSASIRHWPAALFNYDRLLSIRPGDPAVTALRARALQQSTAERNSQP